MTPRYDEAIRRIDEANAADPNTLDVDGVPHPKEAAHAEMMTRWVRALRPAANEPLLLAARAHHIRRWERPRDSFPAGREGYLRWRAMLQRFHADALGEIMTAAGYEAAEVKRAQDLVRKRGLGRDPDAQAMEDALCLVFMETQLADFAGHPRRRRPHDRSPRQHLAQDEPRRPRRRPSPRPRRPRRPPPPRRRPSRGDRTGVQADPPEAHVTDASPAARRPTAAKLYRLLIILTPLVILLQGFLFGGFYSGGGATMLDIHLWLGRISFAVVLAVILPAALRAGFDPASRIVPATAALAALWTVQQSLGEGTVDYRWFSALHVPLGITMFGFSLVLAGMVWRRAPLP